MRVNIIIPAYMRFKSLKRTMKSIRESDHKDIYTIIIMDGFQDERYEQFKDDETEVRQNVERKGWIYSMNETLKHLCDSPPQHPLESGYFYGADDIVFYPDCISRLVKAMKEIFPTGDGLVSTKQHLILSREKIKPKKCGGAFALMGRKFVDRFPNKEAFCPEYFHGSADREIRNFAVQAGIYHFCQDAIVLHDRSKKDECRKLRKAAQPKDHEVRRERWAKELVWGKSFEKVRK